MVWWYFRTIACTSTTNNHAFAQGECDSLLCLYVWWFPKPGASHTLIYDTVITNEGNGYHSATGSFIAPQTGFYVFSWTMRLANGEYHRAELVHNHKVMGVAYLYAPTGDHMVSDVVVFHVNQGDDVFVRTQTGANNGDIESGFGGRSSFTGWKLN